MFRTSPSASESCFISKRTSRISESSNKEQVADFRFQFQVKLNLSMQLFDVLYHIYFYNVDIFQSMTYSLECGLICVNIASFPLIRTICSKFLNKFLRRFLKAFGQTSKTEFRGVWPYRQSLGHPN